MFGISQLISPKTGIEKILRSDPCMSVRFEVSHTCVRSTDFLTFCSWHIYIYKPVLYYFFSLIYREKDAYPDSMGRPG